MQCATREFGRWENIDNGNSGKRKEVMGISGGNLSREGIVQRGIVEREGDNS